MSMAADIDLAIHQIRLREALSGGHWVTAKGGAHLYISDGGASGAGTVLGGPKQLVGANVVHLPDDPTHHPEGHTPEGATSQEDYHETDDKGGRKAADMRYKALDDKIAKKGGIRAYHMTLAQINLAKEMVRAGKLRVSGPRTDEVYSPAAPATDGDAPTSRTMTDSRLRSILTAGGNAGKNPARKWGK